MNTYCKNILLITILLVLYGCSGNNVVSNVSKYNSAIDFAKNGTKNLSAYLDNTLYKRPEDTRKTRDLNVYKTNFYPTKVSSIPKSFAAYCKSIGGVYKHIGRVLPSSLKTGGLCSSNTNEEKAHFYLRNSIVSTKSGFKNGIEVFESITSPSTSTVDVARKDGYLTSKDKNSIKAASLLRQKRAKAARIVQKAAYQNEMKARRLAHAKKYGNLSKKTRSLVVKRGTTVCRVSTGRKQLGSIGYTEEYTNGKIRVRMIGNTIFWEKPESWYACE